jgi:hypothetical protein
MYLQQKIILCGNSENVVQNKNSNIKKILRRSKTIKKRAKIITVSKLQLLSNSLYFNNQARSFNTCNLRIIT